MIDCFKTENYLAEKKRMSKTTESGVCKVECTNCLLSSYNNGDGICCTDFEMLYPKKAIEVVQRWSDEHPGKTYLTEFLSHYPNAEVNGDGIPSGICPYELGVTDNQDCRKNCIECWNQPIEDGEE
jgi:hypothetical protein